eukprot:1056247-Rhodomonas_salina.4
MGIEVMQPPSPSEVEYWHICTGVTVSGCTTTLSNYPVTQVHVYQGTQCMNPGTNPGTGYPPDEQS